MIPLDNEIPETDETGQFDMEKSHQGPLPFRCPICMKPFPTDIQLQEHQRINAHYSPPAPA